MAQVRSATCTAINYQSSQFERAARRYQEEARDVEAVEVANIQAQANYVHGKEIHELRYKSRQEVRQESSAVCSHVIGKAEQELHQQKREEVIREQTIIGEAKQAIHEEAAQARHIIGAEYHRMAIDAQGDLMQR